MGTHTEPLPDLADAIEEELTQLWRTHAVAKLIAETLLPWVAAIHADAASLIADRLVDSIGRLEKYKTPRPDSPDVESRGPVFVAKDGAA